MAFPTVAGTNTGGLTTAATSFSPTRDANPSADDIEILFVAWATAGQADPFATTPSGWTQFLWEDRNLGATQGGAWYWRRATGSEGTTAIGTFNSFVSTKLAWIYYRIAGAHTTQAPEGTDTQSGGNVAPPSHTASWGSEDNLWIAGVAMGTELSAFSAAPTNYTNLITSNSGSAGAATSNVEMGSARRNLAASSDTPGTFTNAANVASVAALVVVRPAPAGGNVTATVDTLGAVTFTGQTVNVRETVRSTVSTVGAVTFTGQTVNTSVAQTVQITTLGAVTFAGQTINVPVSATVTAGSVTFTGQSVNTSVAVTAQVSTPGAVTFTGQTLTTPIVMPVTPGAVTFTGQTVTTRVALTAPVTTPGAVTFTGQTVNFREAHAVTPGVVTWTGQTVGAGQVITVPVDPGALALAGQAVALAFLEQIAPGAATFTGQDVTVVVEGLEPPLIITHEGPEAGGAASGAVLSLTREGAKAGGAASGSVHVVTREGP